MTTIGPASAKRAPMTADSPTPPAPMTTTLSPARTPAVLTTAPKPVVTAQPISAASSGGVPGSIGIAASCATTWRSPKVPIPE